MSRFLIAVLVGAQASGGSRQLRFDFAQRSVVAAADLGFTQKILRFAQDFGSGLPLRSRPLIASTSLTPAKRLNTARIPQRLPQHRDRRESEERR